MGLFKNYINQTRKPEGVLGKAMLNGMNSGHAKMADWGMSYLNISSPERIADIGCGGGATLKRLAAESLDEACFFYIHDQFENKRLLMPHRWIKEAYSDLRDKLGKEKSRNE